jgi:hypothetical protein
MRGPEAREIIILIHQTSVAVSLDRPLTRRGKDASKANGSPEELRFAILVGYDHEQQRAAWQDGESGRLESLIQEIAVEVVTSAEISYREGCFRGFEWRVKRKAQLEEERRNHQLRIEREELERQQKIEQARVDRLLEDAKSLRRATDIRAYVAAVQAIVANETASISAEEMQRWSKWALVAADRIAPVRSARFIRVFEIDGDAN